MMKRFILTILMSAFIFVLQNTAQARVSIKESTKHYNVRGKLAKDVFKQIKKKGPKYQRGKRALSIMKMKLVSENAKIKIRGRYCVVDKIHIKVKIVHTLPRWSNQKQGSGKARKKWRAYYKQLVRFHSKRSKITKNFAKKLDREIRKATDLTSRNCSRLKHKVKRVVEKLEKQHDRQQISIEKSQRRSTSRMSKLLRAFITSD